jgi:acyl-CoA synthetase (AMP-forming)/AMP-acid ligase II
MYGATEASARLTYLPPEHFEEKMGSVGVPIPEVDVRFIDEYGSEVPTGQIGELVVYGPNIMRGYWQDHAGSSLTLNDAGGYHTGDIGYRDKDGFIYLICRQDHQIKVGGHKVNLCEVEDVLVNSGQVIEAAVVGVEDHLLGNKLCALVVPGVKEDGDFAERLLKMCSEVLPRFKIPTEMKTLRVLPKNDSGKVDRQKCLELFKQ